MMKKVLSVLLVLSMTAAMFVGCGSKEEAPAETPAAEEEAAEEEAELEEAAEEAELAIEE